MADKKIRLITQTAVFCALACVFAFVENMLLPPMPMGVKLGISNLLVLLALELIGVKSAFFIVISKSAFVFLTRGVTAFLMSSAGGIVSFIIAVILIRKTKNSCVLISSLCGIFHNLGQLSMASVLTASAYSLWYFPVLCVCGCASGIFVGILFYVICKRLCNMNFFEF